MFNTKSNNKKFIFSQTVKVCIDLNSHTQKTSQEPDFPNLIILIQISMPTICDACHGFITSILVKIRHVFWDTFLPGNSVEHFLK